MRVGIEGHYSQPPLRRTRQGPSYTMRVGIAGHYSSLKRMFGDEVRSKNARCAEHEIRLKVAIYNDMIDMAESNGRTGKRILLPSSGDAGGESGGCGGRRGAPGGRNRRRPSGGCGDGSGRREEGGGGNADCGAGEGHVGAKTSTDEALGPDCPARSSIGS